MGEQQTADLPDDFEYGSGAGEESTEVDPVIYSVEALGWGLKVANGELIATGAKADMIKQGKAEARVNTPAVVEVQNSAGKVIRRDYF